MEYLDEKLKDYSKSGVYPFHMPGHKRAEIDFANPYSIDITEIDGFDNLHHAEEILKEAQERAAEVFHSKKTFYLINGSTCGLLSAISATVQKQDKILMARNCHKAVYHAAFLNELQVEYVYPKITEFGIQGVITPEDVERELLEHLDITAVVITSPTYDGIVSDIEGIAKIVHAHKIPLIVDEAHGAHFSFHERFPKSAVECGADIVIQSLHKTLPSFTQTALLHLDSKYIKESAIKKYLGIYETSSPSYLFMAGMDKCVRMLKEDGKRMFEQYVERLDDFYEHTKCLKNIRVLTKEQLKEEEAFDFDFGKIIISVKGTNLSGQELYRRLLSQYKLQMEMASGFYVVAMTSIMDCEDGFMRLYNALMEIDEECEKRVGSNDNFVSQMYVKQIKDMEIYQAESLPIAKEKLVNAIGRTAGEYVYLYPPGIPLLVPGEVITSKFVENMEKCGKLGLNIQGMEDNTNERINVVNF